MKAKKEIITGISTIAAILILVTGINFLKGNSFFGGDDVYYAYFSNSGGVTPATSVMVNGVEVGKVLDVQLTGSPDSLRKVLIKFNIQQEDFKISKSSTIEAGSLDLFAKGLTLSPGEDISQGYYEIGDKIQGVVLTDITSQVKSYADPITQKLQVMMGSIDKMVTGISAFWDTTATSEIEQSLHEVKIAIKKFGNAADQIDELIATERIRLSSILSNVQTITENLKRSNENVKAIVGNVKTITDDLVTADFKSVIGDAQKTLQSITAVLDSATKGSGTLAKLVNDEALYNELVQTNKDLQSLLTDLQLHPERYIHFSVLGSKTKGVSLTKDEEKQLRQLLDSSKVK